MVFRGSMRPIAGRWEASPARLRPRSCVAPLIRVASIQPRTVSGKQRDERGAEADEGDEGERVGYEASQGCEDAAITAIRHHHHEDAPEHHVDEIQADAGHHDRGDQADDDQGGPDQQAEQEDVATSTVADERGRACREELGDKPDRHRDHGFDDNEEPADRGREEIEHRQERQQPTDHEGDHEQRDRDRQEHGRRDARERADPPGTRALVTRVAAVVAPSPHNPWSEGTTDFWISR